MNKKPKLTKEQRAEISRQNITKANQARKVNKTKFFGHYIGLKNEN